MDISERSTNDPSELQPCSLPVSVSPRKSRLRQRLILIGFVLSILAAVSIVVLHEAHTSRLQARKLAYYAAALDYEVRQGPNKTTLFPVDGPFDRRLGYQLLPSSMQCLYDRDYVIARQVHFSPTLMRYAEYRLFPPCTEKAQAGLNIADCHGVLIYDFRYPQRHYANFASLPPLAMQSLLFIENRNLLDHERPYLNPTVDQGRFTQVALSQVGRMLGFSAHSSGGNTLTTQIKKYRHSAEGRTSGIGDRLRQMLSTSVRSYREDPADFAARQDVMLTYLNSVPLSATPGYGGVTSLTDGLWVWCGADYRRADETFDGKAKLAAQGLALRQVLALMIAHRRPSFYLAPRGHDELNRMTDSHLRVLTQAGIVEALSRDAVLAQKLAFRDPRSQPAVQPLPTNKGMTLARTRLVGMLGVSLYDLDHLDLRANTTLQHELQESVAAYSQKLADLDYAAQLGLTGERLLTPTSTHSVHYSPTLFERTPSGNQVRAQTDSTDQPFDINEDSKLELGSIAKLWVLANYLGTIAQIHRDYDGMSVAELCKVEVGPLDFILRWGIDHLVASRNRDLSAMLQAAMERRYSAGPYESFFTGGRLHTFSNFRREDNGCRPVLLEALRGSISLPFARLLRDLTHHDIYQNAGSKVQLLANDKDPYRANYLDHFVGKESQVYLCRFWVEYRDKDANQHLEIFLDDLCPWSVRLIAIHRCLQPQADLANFSAFLREYLPRGNLTDKRTAELYERYGPDKFNLSDQSYIARVYPLELWLFGYLQKQPQATFDEAMAASGAEHKEVCGWLLRSRHKNTRDKRIRILLEVEAFLDLHQQQKKLGYPFDRLVPSYAIALNSSGDRPATLAELMGIIVNDGVRIPTLRLEHLDFALDTPYEARFAPEATLDQRAMTSEITATLRNTLSQVIDAGTAQRLQGTSSRSDGAPLMMGDKTGIGGSRLQTFSAGDHVHNSKALSRTTTFVFYVGPQHFGALTTYVSGSESSQFKFTSALPMQVLKGMAPLLRDYLNPRAATHCQIPLSPQRTGRL